MTRFRDALNRETSFEYDSDGVLVGIDALGRG
jgi:YD repeat-containing protein